MRKLSRPVRLDPPDGRGATTLLHWLEHNQIVTSLCKLQARTEWQTAGDSLAAEVLNRIEYWVG